MLVLKAQWPYILNFLIYLGVTIPLMGLGAWIFARITPYKEELLLGDGADQENAEHSRAAEAVAHDMGGRLMGLALVLASAIYHSVGVLDMLLWGVIGIVCQIGIFYVFEWLTPYKVTTEIPRGNKAVGVLSAWLSVVTGLLLAALISY